MENQTLVEGLEKGIEKALNELLDVKHFEDIVPETVKDEIEKIVKGVASS